MPAKKSLGDKELEAIQKVWKAASNLPYEVQLRVLGYVESMVESNKPKPIEHGDADQHKFIDEAMIKGWLKSEGWY